MATSERDESGSNGGSNANMAKQRDLSGCDRSLRARHGRKWTLNWMWRECWPAEQATWEKVRANRWSRSWRWLWVVKSQNRL